MNNFVSIIIPTKNSERTIGTCIDSINEQSYQHIECIVVDNNSSDSTQTIARQKQIRIINAGDERSAQRNIGTSHAHGDFLLFIDSDMELERDLVAQCIEIITKNNSIQAIIIPEESFGTGFWAECKRFERSFYDRVPWMQAVRFFRKDAYEAIGGFNEAMIGAEDFDIHNRIISRFGSKSIQTISANIMHNEGNLSLRALMKKKFYYGSNIEQYKSKNHNKSAYKKQASIVSRLILFSSQPKKSILHPMLFCGTIYMKIVEFISGGLAHIAKRYARKI